jgi:deoxyribonuclease V
MLRGRFSVKRARRLQSRLAKRVMMSDMLPDRLNHVAGVDVAYIEGHAIGAAVVLDYASLSLVEAQVAEVKTSFPYIPTLLSFREIKPARAAIKKLKARPDVFLVDAQGIAHPYRLGFASHLGLLLDEPTIGVAKSLLCGTVEPTDEKGWLPITDKGEVIGAELSRNEIVKHFTKATRIPEPIRLAHLLAAEEKMKHKRKISSQ